MTEGLLFVITGSLLTLAAAALFTAVLTLRHARRYVELAEERLESLREDQAHLLMLLRQERQRSQEEEEEWEQRPQARHEERRARRSEGRRIAQVKRELLGLPEVRRESPSSLPEGPQEEEKPGAPEQRSKKESAWPTHKAAPRAGTPPPPTSTKPAQGPPAKGKGQALAVWQPHPDDDVSPARQTPLPGGDTPLRMFHTYYDRYLDNYEGYVKLAHRLYLMRERGEVPAGSAAEREWEEKLRRAEDGIQRTTGRLDLLEEYNPELATDERVSRRASVARSHSQLESRGRGGRGS